MMAILVDKNTRVLIQGITGKSGREVASELLDYGTKVVAGVTPGKGGQEVDTVPVFGSIKEAVNEVGKIDCSMVYVPPLMAKDAVLEAIEVQIPLVHIFVVRILRFLQHAKKWPSFQKSLKIKNKMAILINKDTRVLIQGVTGKSGREVASELLDYGTKVVAGVAAGKGGPGGDT